MYVKHDWDSSNYVSSSHYIFYSDVLINVTFLKRLSSLLELWKIVPRGLNESHVAMQQRDAFTCDCVNHLYFKEDWY